MAKYESITIAELIKNIETQKMVLPAMQRNFVWPEEKICKLFDSIMRDYPIGTFLFWDVNTQIFNEYVFNVFSNGIVNIVIKLDVFIITTHISHHLTKF